MDEKTYSIKHLFVEWGLSCLINEPAKLNNHPGKCSFIYWTLPHCLLRFKPGVQICSFKEMVPCDLALNKSHMLNAWQCLSVVTFISDRVMDRMDRLLNGKRYGDIGSKVEPPAAAECTAGVLLVKMGQNQLQSEDWKAFLCHNTQHSTLLKLKEATIIRWYNFTENTGLNPLFIKTYVESMALVRDSTSFMNSSSSDFQNREKDSRTKFSALLLTSIFQANVR